MGRLKTAHFKLKGVIVLGKSLADKMAEKALNGAVFKRSFAVHERAFGPILTPAFKDNAPALVTLCAALNLISAKKTAQAEKKLKALEAFVKTEADSAMWNFAMALSGEIEGNTSKALFYYAATCETGTDFYLPYLKLAKLIHTQSAFDEAEELYEKAIERLGESEAEKFILASAYANLCSVCTMKHDYVKAEDALRLSCEAYAAYPGREATAAMLYAAMGNAELTDRYLSMLREASSPYFEQTKSVAERIMRGEHPHFSAQSVDADRIDSFRRWFDERVKDFDGAENEALAKEISVKLSDVFPFMEAPIPVRVENGEGAYTVVCEDRYVIALAEGLKTLREAMPDEISNTWKFDIIHGQYF